MKKIIIFILSLLVLITMTLSFVACGSEEGDSGESNSNTQNGTNKTDGKEDALCAHRSVKGELIKFSDYGDVCGGGIYSEQCQDCGKALNSGSTLVTFCTYEDTQGGMCVDCGLEISKAVSKNGCDITTTYSATLGKTKIFENISDTKEHSPTLEITKHTQSGCLITVANERCKDCGFTNLRSTKHQGSELIVVNEQAGGKSIKTSSCADCGYKEVREYSEVADCTNEQVGHIEMSLYHGNTLLYSGKSNQEKSHNWETTALLYGSDCKAGAVTVKACVTCGEREYGAALDHIVEEEKYDLEGVDSCGSYLTVKKCFVCGYLLGIGENPEECYFKETENEFANGGTRVAYECVDCGLILESEKTGTAFTVCEQKITETVRLSKDTETVFLYENEYIIANHYDTSYDYTYELLGESCLDGIVAVGVCKDCGYTERIVMNDVNYHKMVSREVVELNLPCGGTLESDQCVCGAVKSIHGYEGCELLTSGEDSVEINGVNFSVTTKTCADCDAVRIHKYTAVTDGCYTHYYEQIEYVLHEATVYDSGMCDTYIAPNHQIERTSLSLGPSCEADGALAVTLCENCDYYTYSVLDYHYKTEVERIGITAHGACGGYIVIKRCPCDVGEIYTDYGGYVCDFSETFEESESGRTNTRVCNDCGFTIENVIKYIYRDCQRIDEETVTYSINQNVIYEHKNVVNKEEFHQLETTFRLLAEHCYEGLYEINKCKDCDYKKVTAHYDCVIKERIEFGFREYGVCEGAYYYYTCHCGNSSNEYYSLFCDMVESEPQYETIDGVEYKTVTATCPTCGVIETEVRYIGIEGCYEYEYVLRTVVIGEKTLVKDALSRSFNRSYHETATTIEPLGESCIDGFYENERCTKCDYVTSVYYNYHMQYRKYSYYGGDNCAHNVMYEECPCGAEHDLNIGFVEEVEGGYACDECGFRVDIKSESEKADCKEINKTVKQVYIGSELQFEVVDINVYDKHSFAAPVLTNADGKETITSKCNDCGFELIQEIYIMVYEDGDWGKKCELSFTVGKDGEYTLYASSVDAQENLVFKSNGEFVASFYSENQKRPFSTAKLKSGEKYEYTSENYLLESSLAAFAVIEGQYSVCIGAEGEIKLTTSDGKYELTLCEGCHMILDVQEKQ